MKPVPSLKDALHKVTGFGDVAKKDIKSLSKDAETLFINEFVKVMMEQTSFGKDKVVGNYMPFITSEVSKFMAEKGIGVGGFFMRSTGAESVKNELKHRDYGLKQYSSMGSGG
ncbi:MAG: hypothetical protein EPN22_07355 [Nitrospirae bacterium]|nr:MAG: hypothetical protein EPN22_07355 [Nitrospirota bacterium]